MAVLGWIVHWMADLRSENNQFDAGVNYSPLSTELWFVSMCSLLRASGGKHLPMMKAHYKKHFSNE